VETRMLGHRKTKWNLVLLLYFLDLKKYTDSTALPQESKLKL
jgi:hypothetical protein